VSELIRRWEPELVAPTKVALDRREGVRREIAQYKVRFGLHEPQ